MFFFLSYSYGILTLPFIARKPYPIPDQNGQSAYPTSDKNGEKTLPLGAAHLHGLYKEVPPGYTAILYYIVAIQLVHTLSTCCGRGR